jgi:hypothetical protein
MTKKWIAAGKKKRKSRKESNEKQRENWAMTNKCNVVRRPKGYL